MLAEVEMKLGLQPLLLVLDLDRLLEILLEPVYIDFTQFRALDTAQVLLTHFFHILEEVVGLIFITTPKGFR